jgi:ribosomal protein L35
MFFHKSGAQKRRLDKDVELSSSERKRVKRLLGL